MKQRKFKDGMTVTELARVTNMAFNKVETRFQEMNHEMEAGFQKIHIDLSETERRLVDAINNVEVRRPEFDALKEDVEDLSGRVGILEKKS